MDAPVDTGADIAAFVAKWRGAWPEWALAETFVPAAHRPLVDAWQALQFEWQEAAWGGVDAVPGQAKLQWWTEELDGWAHGRRRHPLGALLQRQPVAWREIAGTLPSLASTRQQAVLVHDAQRSLTPVASAIADAESVLFGGTSHARAVAACWLHARLARHPDAAVPRELQTSGASDARAAWARVLLSSWPSARGVAAARGIELALARGRLSGGNASRPLSPWSALWAGWRGARG